MHILRKLKRIAGLVSSGNFGKVKDKALYELHSHMVYSRLRKQYNSFVAEHATPNYVHRGGHEDVIWWLWLQGEDNAPDICKACLRSLRHWHSDKKIIVLDQNNLSNYITLPEHITRKHEQGLITHTHFSDIVRTQLLIEHGGTWIDSTVYCTGRSHDEYVMHLPLFLYRDDSPQRHLASWLSIASCLIVSDPHDSILELTQDLLFQYWKDYDCLKHYFLFHMFFNMAARAYIDEYNKMPFISAYPVDEMQRQMYDEYSDEKMRYFKVISDFHKMNHKIDTTRLIPSSILQHVIDS